MNTLVVYMISRKYKHLIPFINTKRLHEKPSYFEMRLKEVIWSIQIESKEVYNLKDITWIDNEILATISSFDFLVINNQPVKQTFNFLCKYCRCLYTIFPSIDLCCHNINIDETWHSIKVDQKALRMEKENYFNTW